MTITADSVVKAYGRTRALDGVSFTAGRGVTGLLGPNGAGKTTLLRILATVLAPDEGRLELLGRDPSTAAGRLETRRRLGYMPQEPGFHRLFTAFEFVDYVAVLKEMTERRARHDEVRRVLDAVGLADVGGKRIRALSGGMRRRLALAQALVGDPALVVLDEPTAGLDPEQRMRFRDLVSRLGEGRTVVLSTHQTEDVAALCEQVVVVDRGRTLFSGAVSELVGSAAGRCWTAQERDAGALVSWRLGTGRFHHVGTPPPGAELVEPSLEDAYLLLLGPGAAVASQVPA